MNQDTQNVSWPGWETVRLIGRGSFGAVYEIQRDMFGELERAALKVISIPQHPGDIEELYADGYDEKSITSTFHNHLRSIVTEYSLMRKLNGFTNIVNCDDVRYVQHDDGIGWDIYIKMELLTPLIRMLSESVTEKMVLRLARDICNALVLCKKHDIVHRDIKPQNIFVSPNGDFKLGDFGIAKTVEKTTGGTMIGTYRYMAPEVFHGLPYGSAADIYSLGLVLYWLLNERRMPFLPLPPASINTSMDQEARHRRFSGEPLPEPAHGSEELKRIVLKACAYKAEDRYASPAEMLADIEHLCEKAPEPAVEETEAVQEEVPAPVVPPRDNDEKTFGIVGGMEAVQPDPQEDATILLPVEVPAAPDGQQKAEPERKPAAAPVEVPQGSQPAPKRKRLIALICAGILLCAAVAFWFLHPHSYGQWQVRKEASCTSEGEQLRKCFCGETETQTITKLEHTVVKDAAVEASCAETGLTEGYHCSVCGEVFVEQVATPLMEHNIVALEAVPASCVNTGLTAGTGCAVCEYVETAQETIEALGHTPVKDAAVASTCAKEGKTEGSHCSVCGEILEAQQPVALLNHSPVTDKAVAATCTTAGKTEGSHCAVCGKVLVAQKSTNKASHTPVTDKAVAATCTTAGKTEGSHCSVCGTVIKAQQATSKASHTPVTDAAVGATCTEAGKTEGSHCSVCGTVIKAQTATGSALGHSFSENKCVRCDTKEWYAVVKPTKSTYALGEHVSLTVTIYSNNPKASSINAYLVLYVTNDAGESASQQGATVTVSNGYTETMDGGYSSSPVKATYSIYSTDGYYLGGCTVTIA